jgi:hypothetical protein
VWACVRVYISPQHIVQGSSVVIIRPTTNEHPNSGVVCILHPAEYHRNISCMYQQTEAFSSSGAATSQISAFKMCMI